jgi:hypothetical protein
MYVALVWMPQKLAMGMSKSSLLTWEISKKYEMGSGISDSGKEESSYFASRAPF